jgi:hypothetical protein
MATITLTVEQAPGEDTGVLLLTDNNGNSGKNLCTEVSKDDKVKWKLKNNSGITSIDGIIDKTVGVNLFSSGPSQKNNDWEGTIGDFTSGIEESYVVEVTINGQVYNHDPKLKMKDDGSK